MLEEWSNYLGWIVIISYFKTGSFFISASTVEWGAWIKKQAEPFISALIYLNQNQKPASAAPNIPKSTARGRLTIFIGYKEIQVYEILKLFIEALKLIGLIIMVNIIIPRYTF